MLMLMLMLVLVLVLVLVPTRVRSVLTRHYALLCDEQHWDESYE